MVLVQVKSPGPVTDPAPTTVSDSVLCTTVKVAVSTMFWETTVLHCGPGQAALSTQTALPVQVGPEFPGLGEPSNFTTLFSGKLPEQVFVPSPLSAQAKPDRSPVREPAPLTITVTVLVTGMAVNVAVAVMSLVA